MVRFSYTGTHANVNLEFPPSGLLDQVKEVLGVRISFKYRFALRV